MAQGAFVPEHMRYPSERQWFQGGKRRRMKGGGPNRAMAKILAAGVAATALTGSYLAWPMLEAVLVAKGVIPALCTSTFSKLWGLGASYLGGQGCQSADARYNLLVQAISV